MGHATDRFLEEALRLAEESADSGGGPFGAVVVRDGEIVARGANRVLADLDPSAHAEVVALRGAARALGTHDLSGTILYASCEPCPMCLGASLWARVDMIVFAADRRDAAAAGFDDERFYRALRSVALGEGSPEGVGWRRVENERAQALLRSYATRPDRRPY
ncbi:MAG TPA: nucleoside deaminase [Planctomycetes bacterium]|nr:nucleoside deaminase [Planctomycetota bacterium]